MARADPPVKRARGTGPRGTDFDERRDVMDWLIIGGKGAAALGVFLFVVYLVARMGSLAVLRSWDTWRRKHGGDR